MTQCDTWVEVMCMYVLCCNDYTYSIGKCVWSYQGLMFRDRLSASVILSLDMCVVEYTNTMFHCWWCVLMNNGQDGSLAQTLSWLHVTHTKLTKHWLTGLCIEAFSCNPSVLALCQLGVLNQWLWLSDNLWHLVIQCMCLCTTDIDKAYQCNYKSDLEIVIGSNTCLVAFCKPAVMFLCGQHCKLTLENLLASKRDCF